MSVRRPLKGAIKKVKKKAGKGFRRYPIATIAYYGPDDKVATKVAVGIIKREDGEVEFLKRWYSEDRDVRIDESINEQILEFIISHKVKTVVMTDRIIGCPHEEGIDYPIGKSCPKCPFWAGRDRWTGELIH